MQYAPATRVDYAGLDEISRQMNRLLGDRTGRTVTQRTQQGMYNMTDGQLDLSGGQTHAVMGATLACLASRNQALMVVGVVGLVFLIVSWASGEKTTTWDLPTFKPPQPRGRLVM